MLRKDVLKYPELKEYRNGGKRAAMNIPSWAAFSYFEFGTIENIYMYLRSDHVVKFCCIVTAGENMVRG